jgi:hypothetical protein
MEQITRRNVLLAGLALPAILETTFRESQGTDDATKKPKRFEEVAGFEVAQAISECPLAILPLGSLSFAARTTHWVRPIIISGIAENRGTNGLWLPVVSSRSVRQHGPLGNAIGPS